MTRKCPNCGEIMEEGYKFTGNGGNVLRKKGFNTKAVYTVAAVCLNCGEISIYVDPEKLNKLKD